MSFDEPETVTGPTRHGTAARQAATVKSHLGVAQVYARLAGAVERMDATLMGEIFTKRAVFVAPDASVLEGRAAIAAGFDEFFDGTRKRGMRLRLDIEIEDRVARDRVVHDQGSYSLHIRIGTAELPFKKGRFLAVFRKGKGSRNFRLDTASVFPLVRTLRPTGGVH